MSVLRTTGRELLVLAKLLCHTDKKSFIATLAEWNKKRGDVLKKEQLCKTGHYTYKSL